MNKKILLGMFSLLGLFSLASCGDTAKTTVTKTEEVKVDYFDNQPIYDEANPTAVYDHYFSNKLRFSQTGTTVNKNKKGELAGDFIKDGVARLALKSYTDGDTAVFYLNQYNSSATSDTFTVQGKTYPYVTIRFLGIDTPESTSSIDPWGKAASKFGKELLKNAAGIIVDASQLETDATTKYEDRKDSNGTRWLGLVWYCPKGGNPEDLTQYRSYQLDLIEECYTFATSFKDNRYSYTADKTTEPILYTRYKEVKNIRTGEVEKRYGSLTLNELFYEAGNRMERTGKVLRIQGETDPNFDYSKEPTVLTITEALKNITENPESNYMTRGTYVQLTGVITRFVGTNLYIMDREGTPLYIYMGIDGNSIDSMFKQGDTISIRGRLCSYGGQYQMSGVVFKSSTFKKLTGDDAIPMPEAINLDEVIAGNVKDADGNSITYNVDYIKSILGKLVTYTFTVNSGASLSLSKDSSYSLTDTKVIPGLEDITTSYDENKLQVRINGTLAPGYDFTEFASYKQGSTMNGSAKGGKYKVTGIMSIYLEDDYTKEEVYPSYQIVVGNRIVVDNGDGTTTVVSEIEKQ